MSAPRPLSTVGAQAIPGSSGLIIDATRSAVKRRNTTAAAVALRQTDASATFLKSARSPTPVATVNMTKHSTTETSATGRATTTSALHYSSRTEINQGHAVQLLNLEKHLDDREKQLEEWKSKVTMISQSIDGSILPKMKIWRNYRRAARLNSIN